MKNVYVKISSTNSTQTVELIARRSITFFPNEISEKRKGRGRIGENNELKKKRGLTIVYDVLFHNRWRKGI